MHFYTDAKLLTVCGYFAFISVLGLFILRAMTLVTGFALRSRDSVLR